MPSRRSTGPKTTIRLHNLKQRLQTDAAMITARAAQGQSVSIRDLLQLRARIMLYAVILDGRDQNKHHQTALEASTNLGRRKLTDKQLAYACGVVEHTAQETKSYIGALNCFRKFVFRRGPAIASMNDKITALLNSSLLDIELRRAARPQALRLSSS